MARIIDDGLIEGNLSLAGGGVVGIGEDVSKNDLLYFCNLTGKSYRVDVSDYAAIGNLVYVHRKAVKRLSVWFHILLSVVVPYR